MRKHSPILNAGLASPTSKGASRRCQPSAWVEPKPHACSLRNSRQARALARLVAWRRFHAVTTPRVLLRPAASHSVPHRNPLTAVPHQAKRRKRPAFSLFFAVLAMAPPARIELATLALGKPCSIQLSYGGGRRRLSRPGATLKLCPGFLDILGFLGGARWRTPRSQRGTADVAAVRAEHVPGECHSKG